MSEQGKYIFIFLSIKNKKPQLQNCYEFIHENSVVLYF